MPSRSTTETVQGTASRGLNFVRDNAGNISIVAVVHQTNGRTFESQPRLLTALSSLNASQKTALENALQSLWVEIRDLEYPDP